jgi:ubiquitin carboxyl-terminal hydrolase L3
VSVDEGYLKNFFTKSANMSPKERADYLGEDEEITEAHETSALEGDTKAPPPEQNVNLHFVSLIHKDGHIYELDGRRPFPVNHGPTTAGNFLQDAAQVCKDYMKRDPNEVNFNIIALASADQ